MSRHRQAARVMTSAERALDARPVRAKVDYDCINRIAAFAAMRRAEMGEARWNELSPEWEN